MDFGLITIVALGIIGYIGWEIYGIWVDTRPNKMKAVFLDAGKNVRTIRVTLNPDGKSFNISVTKKRKMKYHVTEDCVYRLGTWRVPTSYYNVGAATPINIRDVRADNPQSAEEFFIATESNIGRQIIETFESSLITITSSMMVLIITIVIANAFVFIQVKSELEDIKTALGIVPSATE